MIASVDWPSAGNQVAGTLSGGEQQMLAMGRL
jgi:ABC-type branched-subunit amino acid transport system ATPase component